MLIFTYKFEKYIKNNIFQKILLVPNNYIIKGSFRRRIPYITDIDVVNKVYPKIGESNIYDKIVKLIEKLGNREYSDIILVYISCGVDERFMLHDGSDEELLQIRTLLNDQDIKEFDIVLKKYSDNIEKKLFFVSEIIWKYYKLRWTPLEVLKNKKYLSGDITVTLTDEIKKNASMLLQYYVKIGSVPVGIDVVVNYKEIDMKQAYQVAADYQLKLANYSKEYYYMLFPFKHCFRQDKELSKELEDLIEKQFGLFKQLMVRIDTYHTLHQTHNLNIETAKAIVISIIKDINQLPNFQSNISDKIKEVAIDNPPDVKMEKWDILLDVLYDEINATANLAAKDYFYKYLEMVPEDLKKNYCIIEPSQSRIKNIMKRSYFY